MSQLRKILFAVAAFGGAATAVGAGTFASFTASTTNANSTFATGTLVLDNDTLAQTNCLSTGGTNAIANDNAGSCSAFQSLLLTKPGDAETFDVDLQNAGSIGATGLTVAAPAACVGNVANPDANAYTGSADLCTEIAVTIQSYADNAGARGAANGCIYGKNTDGDATTCDADVSYALDLAAFTAGAPIAISAPTTGLAAGASRHYTLGFKVNPDAGNEIQGRQATYAFTWSIAQ